MADKTIEWSRKRLEEILMAKETTTTSSSAEETFRTEFFKRLAEEADKLPHFKDEVKQHLENFQGSTVQVVSGSDESIRPILVFSQACLESVLTSLLKDGILSHVLGIIHTQCPATPVCSPVVDQHHDAAAADMVKSGLVAQEFQSDPIRQETVRIRARVIRQMLEESSIKLNIAYSKEGRSARSQEQLTTYERLLESYPDTLFDLPLECSRNEIKNIEGATYIFAVAAAAAGDDDDDDVVYAYTGRGRQANHPESGDKIHSVGSVRDKDVRKSVLEVLDFLENKDVLPSHPESGLTWTCTQRQA